MEGFHVLSKIRGHRIDFDESQALGGSDEGPNPLELLLASLGACEIILLKIYAEKFDVAVNSIEAEVEGEIDVRGYQNVKGVRSGFQNIRIHTRLGAEGDPQNIKNLIETAEKCCPIFDSISNGVKIESHIDLE